MLKGCIFPCLGFTGTTCSFTTNGLCPITYCTLLFTEGRFVIALTILFPLCAIIVQTFKSFRCCRVDTFLSIECAGCPALFATVLGNRMHRSATFFQFSFRYLITLVIPISSALDVVQGRTLWMRKGNSSRNNHYKNSKRRHHVK